jgi:hypothetical protein
MGKTNKAEFFFSPSNTREGRGGAGRRSQLGKAVFFSHYLLPRSMFQLGEVRTAY